MKGTVLAICLVVFVGQLSAFPNTAIKAPSSYVPGRDLNEAQYYQDLVASFKWRELLEHVPEFLFPILEEILKGIARSSRPEDVIKAILTRDWNNLGGKEKRRRGRKNKKDKKKKKKEEEEEEDTTEPIKKNKSTQDKHF